MIDSGWVLTELEENTLSDLTNLYGNFLFDTLTAFEEWGSGAKGFLEGVGGAFKSMVTDAIQSIKSLVTEQLMASAKTILAEKAKAIASIIAKVMASIPFPFNLAVVGGAIAAVAALFSKIKFFGEGGIAWGPQLAVVAVVMAEPRPLPETSQIVCRYRAFLRRAPVPFECTETPGRGAHKKNKGESQRPRADPMAVRCQHGLPARSKRGSVPSSIGCDRRSHRPHSGDRQNCNDRYSFHTAERARFPDNM